MYRQSLAENLSRNDVIQCLIRKETPKVCRYFPKLTVEWIIKDYLNKLRISYTEMVPL